MDSPYTKELQVAISVVQRAAVLSAHILRQAQEHGHGDIDKEDMGVVAKDDLSPVTIADFAIQALLTCTIHHVFPSDKFVGEESADALRENPALLEGVWAALEHTKSQNQPPAAGETETSPVVHFPETRERMCELIDWCGNGHPNVGGRVWVFDPIDGTENFVKGLVYAINVALLRDGQQVLSVVGCPNMSADVTYPAGDTSLDESGEGCVLLAVKDHGAFVRKLRGTAEESPCRRLARQPQDPSEARALSNIRSTSALNTSGLGAVHAQVARRLGVEWPGSVLLPWVIRWVLLALGVGDATWWVYKERERLAKIWDHAGAMLLFQETGGKVTDVDGREINFTADRKMTANWGFVAAPGNLHAKVLEMVQDVVREQRPELLERPA